MQPTRITYMQVFMHENAHSYCYCAWEHDKWKAPYFSLLLQLPCKLSCTLRVCMESRGAYQDTVCMHISVLLSKGKTLPSIIHSNTSTQCKICGLKFSLRQAHDIPWQGASTAQLKKIDPEDIKKYQCIHRMIQPANISSKTTVCNKSDRIYQDQPLTVIKILETALHRAFAYEYNLTGTTIFQWYTVN